MNYILQEQFDDNCFWCFSKYRIIYTPEEVYMKLFGFLLAIFFYGALFIVANIVSFTMFTILAAATLTLAFFYNVYVLTGEYKNEKRSDFWVGVSFGTIVVAVIVVGWYAYLFFG